MRDSHDIADLNAKRILFVAPRFHSNQSDMVRELVRRGHCVDFIVQHATKSEDHAVIQPRVIEPSWLGVLLNRLLNPRNDVLRMRKLWLPRFGSLLGELRDVRADIAIVRGFTGILVWFTFLYCWATNTKIIAYSQGPRRRTRIDWKRRCFNFLVFRVLRFEWFTPVDFRWGTTEPYVPTKQAYVPFFKYINEAAVDRNYDAPPLDVLCVGKFVPRKNCLLMLEVIDALRKEYEIRLTWIGECTTADHEEYLDQVRRRVGELGLADYVEIVTNLEFTEVVKYYLSHDVFVLPSVNEPASVSQLEAMACGLPIVCGADNGTAHYIDDGKTGFIVRADSESIQGALESYLKNPTLLASHGRAGLHRLETDLSVEKAYDELSKLF